MDRRGDRPVQAQINPRKRAYNILAHVAQARSTVYGWLALSFYEPDEALLAALTDGTVATDLTACTEWLGEQDQQRLLPGIEALAPAAGELEALRAEHGRLFGRSVERISPCEATYRWKGCGDVLGEGEDLRRGLQQLYGQFGVAPAAEPADHIAVQLEFMAYLCRHEAREWEAGASSAARQLRRQASDFLADHPGKWIPAFSWRLSRQASGSFYAIAAGLADRWLEFEQGPDYRPVRAG